MEMAMEDSVSDSIAETKSVSKTSNSVV